MKLTSVLGRYTGRSFRFLKRKETKTAWLITAWSAETFAFALTVYTLLLFGSQLSAFTLLLVYAYGTYALYSMILSNS